MLTLADIDEMFPATMDGSCYSDLYKDVYGCRPRGCQFESLEAFQADADWLHTRLQEEMVREEEAQRQAVIRFEKLVSDVMSTVNVDRFNAIRIVADAEECALDFEHADYDAIDYSFGMPYGYTKRNLREVV